VQLRCVGFKAVRADGQTVLIVEDDRRMAAFLDRALAFEGYRPLVVGDGEQALATASREPPQLVVLDVTLPGISGLDVAREIRRSSGVPILMLTAREGLADRIIGLDAGADDYVGKPFALQELLARMRALLRGRDLALAGARRGTLTFEDICLDQDRLTATRNGRRLSLRNKELELLAHFLRHPRRVFEARTLLVEVWGYAYLGDANVVHVTLRRLRQELETDGSRRVIHTVRPGGYELRSALDASNEAA
jgi:two-component system response regulator MprA